MWHSTLVDFFRKRLPFESNIRVYSKRVVEDTRSLMRFFLPWRHLEECHPTTLYLETTNICNADCVFCAYKFQKEFRQGKGIMSDEIFGTALKQYREMGGKRIAMTPLVGEPLLDPKVVERVRMAKDMGFHVSFFTNGILLGRIDLQGLLKTGLDNLVLSTGPFEKASHELLFRTNKYEEMIEGVRELLVLRNALYAPLEVTILFRSHIPYRELVGLPDYRDKIYPLLSEEERRKVYVQIKCFDTWGGQIRKKDLPGIMDVAYPPVIKRRPCLWTFFAMVLWDGHVRACSCRFTGTERQDGDDGLLIGHLGQESLQDIWKGEGVKILRRRFLAGNLPLVCRKCTMYRSC